MGKMLEAPRHNVISLRISDQEWAMIHNFKDESKQSISDILRDALTNFFRQAAEGEEDDFPCQNES